MSDTNGTAPASVLRSRLDGTAASQDSSAIVYSAQLPAWRKGDKGAARACTSALTLHMSSSLVTDHTALVALCLYPATVIMHETTSSMRGEPVRKERRTNRVACKRRGERKDFVAFAKLQQRSSCHASVNAETNTDGVRLCAQECANLRVGISHIYDASNISPWDLDISAGLSSLTTDVSFQTIYSNT